MDPRSPSSAYAVPVELTRDSRIFARPLPKVTAHFTLLRRYAVDLRYYVPAALDMPDVEFPDAVLVSETVEKQEDNVLTFTRLFATIPTSWAQSSSAVVDLPGIQAAPTYATATVITAIDAKLGDVQTITANAHGLSAGDRVRIYVHFKGTSYNVSKWFIFSGHYQVLTAATNTFTVALGSVNLPSEGGRTANVWSTSDVSGSVAEQTAGYMRRAVKTTVVPVSVEHSYYLPGFTLGAPSRKDIVLPQPFSIELGTEDADTFPAATVGAGTVPTAANYWSMVQQQAELILNVELEEYLGNILCRKVTTYTAR